MYVGTRANVGVAIVKENKKKPETQELNFEGYANIVEAMVMRMKEYFDKTMESGDWWFLLVFKNSAVQKMDGIIL